MGHYQLYMGSRTNIKPPKTNIKASDSTVLLSSNDSCPKFETLLFQMHPFSGFWVSSFPYWSSLLVVFLFFSSTPAPLTHQYFQGASLCSLFFSLCPLSSLGDVTDTQVTLKFTWHLCELQALNHVSWISHLGYPKSNSNRNSDPPTCSLFLIPQVGE